MSEKDCANPLASTKRKAKGTAIKRKRFRFMQEILPHEQSGINVRRLAVDNLGTMVIIAHDLVKPDLGRRMGTPLCFEHLGSILAGFPTNNQ